MAERIVYQVTERDEKKAEKETERAQARRARADANKKKLGRRYGLECRQAGADALKGDIEYYRGIGQGRYDAHLGLGYSEERSDSAYNLGYYRGYMNYERDVRGGLVVEIREG